MKQYILPVVMLFSSFAMAQDVDVDKSTGLVKVDDQEVFYLTAKNKSLMESDFSLENLQHEELAYLKLVKGEKYNSGGGTSTTINYQMVFTKTGNQCMLTGFGMLSIIKPLAKRIAGANLVKDGKVSDAEERKFILLNNGTFLKPIAPAANNERVIVVNDNPKPSGPADISLKDNNIYNNSEMVGIFKRIVEGDMTVISVYNANDALICKATHPTANEDADWSLQLDGKAVAILYNKAAPLEKLFKYLVEKGHL